MESDPGREGAGDAEAARWPRWLRRWLRRRSDGRARLARDLDEEVGLHVDLRVASLVRRGLPEEQARSEAVRRFGWDVDTRAGLMVQALKRERRMRVRSWLSGLIHDAGASVRAVVREPGLSLVIVLTLALGLGANAIMFGLIDRLLLRGPAHVHADEDLYCLYLASPSGAGGATSGLGYVSYRTFRDGMRSFDGVGAYATGRATLGRGASAEPVSMTAATSDFFPLLGVSAYLGRFPSAQEDLPPTGENVVALGHDLWRRRYGGDQAVLGSTITFDDASYTVIGVAPPGARTS